MMGSVEGQTINSLCSANHAIQSMEAAFGLRSGASFVRCDPEDVSYALQNTTTHSGIVSKVKMVFAWLLVFSWTAGLVPVARPAETGS